MVLLLFSDTDQNCHIGSDEKYALNAGVIPAGSTVHRRLLTNIE
jgi:hypothetical protein